MQRNNIIKKIEKEFRHNLPLEYDINKINYKVSNFYSEASIIGNGRLIVISGSYNLYWKDKYRVKTYKLLKSFQELIYTDTLKLNFSKIKVKSFLQGKPRLIQSNYSHKYAKLIGDITCQLYIDILSQEVDGGAVVRVNTPQLQEDELELHTDNSIEEDINSKMEGLNNNEIDLKIAKEKKITEQKDIICISSTRWDFIWQRPHHLMERLSKRNNRVLFFNHSMALSYEQAEEILVNPELWDERLKRISKNLWIFSPIHIIQGQKILSDKIRHLNYKLKEEALKYFIYKLQFYEPIFISYLAESINYIKNLPRKLLCYDCIDDFSAFSWAEDNFEIDEKALIDESDIVITSAEELYNRIKEIKPNTFLLPNAVEYDHFALERTSKNFSKNNSPVIGFIGAFYEWIDEEILEYLAEMRKDWSIYIVGPTQAGMGNRINLLANVKFFGTKDYKSLPDYLYKMDVCIIPFKLNRITNSANPIKLWEYMASGKPIVSTPIPEVGKFADIIYIAHTREEFLLKIEEALEENSISLQSQRIEVAKKNDWNHRVEKLIEIMNSIMA